MRVGTRTKNMQFTIEKYKNDTFYKMLKDFLKEDYTDIYDKLNYLRQDFYNRLVAMINYYI
jgi:hypothetical protein